MSFLTICLSLLHLIFLLLSLGDCFAINWLLLSSLPSRASSNSFTFLEFCIINFESSHVLYSFHEMFRQYTMFYFLHICCKLVCSFVLFVSFIESVGGWVSALSFRCLWFLEPKLSPSEKTLGGLNSSPFGKLVSGWFVDWLGFGLWMNSLLTEVFVIYNIIGFGMFKAWIKKNANFGNLVSVISHLK